MTGKGLPFISNAPSGTGILDVQSLPNGAEVFLNGERVGTTPATFRFLAPGQHAIEVRYTGYHSWKKQLYVQAGQVTYAGSLSDTIRLLPSHEPQIIAEDVAVMTIAGNQTVYTTSDNQLITYDLDRAAQIRTTSVNQPITQLRPTGKTGLLFAKQSNSGWALLDVATLNLTPLPALLAQSSQIELTDNNAVFGLNQNRLIVGNGQQARELLPNVSGFTVHGNLLYLITTAPNYELATYFWDGATLSKQTLLLAESLPSAESVSLYLTNQKELFWLSEQSLYRVNQQLDLLKNSVLAVDFNPNKQRLTFYTPTEIFFYNFISNRVELLSRTTTGLSNAIVMPNIGFGFIAGAGGSEAIEIDSRDQQNRYQLYESVPLRQMLISTDESKLLLLNENRLYSIQIKR